MRDHIENIADLLLGALYADRDFNATERSALRKLLTELIARPELPEALQARIERFVPEHFDVAAAAREFSRDPPMTPRRLLELAAQLCAAGGEFDFDKDEYLRRLGRALGMRPVDYDDLVLDYEMYELEGEGGEVASGARRPPPMVRVPARAASTG